MFRSSVFRGLFDNMSVHSTAVSSDIGDRFDSQKSLSFDDIFIGIVFRYIEDEHKRKLEIYKDGRYSDVHGNFWPLPFPSHSRAFQSAVSFLDSYFPAKTNVVKTIETLLQGYSQLTPGNSRVSVPFHFSKGASDEQVQEEYAMRESIKCKLSQIKDGFARETEMTAGEYCRIFGQILSATLEVGHKRSSSKNVMVVNWNYDPNYVVEGLKNGTIVVDGPVGDLFLKHAEGGTAYILGNAGEDVADCADNVTVYVRGNVKKVGHCMRQNRIYVSGKVLDRTDNWQEIEDKSRGNILEEGFDFDKAYKEFATAQK